MFIQERSHIKKTTYAGNVITHMELMKSNLLEISSLFLKENRLFINNLRILRFIFGHFIREKNITKFNPEN
jgi:hypothetical protein